MQRLLISIGLIFFCMIIQAQKLEADLDLIKNTNFVDHKYDKRQITYLFASSNSNLVKYNPVSLTLGGLMYLYQSSVSPQFSSGCLYEPSCSEYTKQLIQTYGIFKGIPVSADRLMRCNRFAALDITRFHVNKKTGKVKEDMDTYRNSKCNHDH